VTREEFDALLDTALAAMTKAAPVANPEDPATYAELKDALEEAQLLEAEARAFADAVDRVAPAQRLPYESAAVLEGSQGVAVVALKDFDSAPIYWRSVAGRLDRLIFGDQLLTALRVAAQQGTPAKP
jgi:hypothetical protein